MSRAAKKCFGSVDCDDGAREYASRDCWSAHTVKLVKELESLYHHEVYLPSSLAKDSDDFGPSAVYRCPVPTKMGFGVNGGGSGWGEAVTISKLLFCSLKKFSLFVEKKSFFLIYENGILLFRGISQ